uniref:Uncharacterized protein n=1 Tax=Acanthochromis polyacanthus TaxID=80966 RepID=A0A3Q1G5A2_9TELE
MIFCMFCIGTHRSAIAIMLSLLGKMSQSCSVHLLRPQFLAAAFLSVHSLIPLLLRMPALILMLHQSFCPSHTPFLRHSWTRCPFMWANSSPNPAGTINHRAIVSDLEVLPLIQASYMLKVTQTKIYT